ncbi:LpxL/LpxP family acyltransferase [Chitiniphilus eburneus]|uniref:Acyltransferase n=1 Tax=Chitiniphilus eburneus TaxID=2571148 RepID=A0A4U0PT59_9NEIS|nr:acyltransferase [Chitiniphilus eburneus]TJZ70692.1 acyltransferase [Chitiniphilus eburneus]
MHWARIGEAGFLTGMRTLLWIDRHLGRWPLRLALYPVLAWYVLARPLARRASRDYLARLHAHSGGATPRPTLGNVFRHFASFGETLLDKVAVWSGKAIDTPHTMDGGEHFIAQQATGRGAVIVTAHLGNVELSRALARQRRGARLNVLVHTRHAPQFNRLLREANPDCELDLIQVSELSAATAVMLSERVERGEFIVIAGDRVPLSAGHRVRVDFLGAPADFPAGPALLAGLLHCPLLALLLTERADGWQLTIRSLANEVRLPRHDRLAAVRPIVAAFAALLEAECRAAPLQWFNFYPFWEDPTA